MSNSESNILKWAGVSLIILLALLIGLLFSRSDGERSTTIANSHYGTITSIELLPDESGFVSAAFDYKIKIWDLEKKVHVKTIDSQVRVIEDFALLKTTNTIIGVASEGTFYFMDAIELNIKNTLDPLYYPIEEINVSDDEKYLAARTAEVVIIFEILNDMNLSEPVFLDDVRHQRVQGFAFRDNQLISIGSEGKVLTWDYKQAELADQMHLNQINQHTEISEDGSRLIISYPESTDSNRTTIEQWNLSDGSLNKTIGSCEGNVLDMLLLENKESLVVSCSDSPLSIYNLSGDVSEKNVWNELKPGIRDLSYSEIQDALIYRYGDNIEVIWDFSSKHLRKVL
jgi:WD40 repeat protein